MPLACVSSKGLPGARSLASKPSRSFQAHPQSCAHRVPPRLLGCRMVLRHPACIIPVTLLVLGLRPATGRVFPRFALGSSFSGRLGKGQGQQRQDTAGSSLRQRTALRLGEGGQSCSVPGGISRRGAWGITVASELRGGATGGVDSEEEDDDSLDDDDEDFDDDDGMDEEDFGEANFVDRLKQDWRKTPIITKTFFQVSIGIALVAAFFNGNQWPSFLLLDWQPTIFKLQLWRLFTPFLYLGPVGANFLLTVHFAWTYMSQLEKLHYREPHTFVMLLAFGMGSLLLLTLVTGADVDSSYTLGHSLSCFLVMVWSRKFAGTKVNVLDMFELSTELLPYFFVAQTLMMEGVVPWVDLSGLLIGYAWQTLSMKGLLDAPKPLVNLFRNNAFLRAEYARAGKEYGQEMPLHDDDDDDAAVAAPDAADGMTEAEEEQPDGEKETRAAVAEAEGKGGGRRRGGAGMASSGGARGAAKAEEGARGDRKGAESVPSPEQEDEEEEEEEEGSEEETARESDETEEDEYSSEEEGEEENDGGDDGAEGSEEGEEEEGEGDLVSEESDELEDDFDEESMLDDFEDDLDAEELSDSFEESEEDSYDI